MMVTIVGIDPGLAATGIGIVRGQGQRIAEYSFGDITTSKSDPLPKRLHQIFSRLLGILQDEAPAVLVVEDIFSLKEYPRSGIVLGKVTGAVLLAGYQAQVPAVEIPVREVKQVLTGNGNCSKAQLERVVRRTLGHGEPIRPTHASDALGLALLGLFRFGCEPDFPSQTFRKRFSQRRADDTTA
jgi:crossover junction endodeoxyribonuclease RuvC